MPGRENLCLKQIGQHSSKLVEADAEDSVLEAAEGAVSTEAAWGTT